MFATAINAAVAQTATPQAVVVSPASKSQNLAGVAYLAATRAGNRIVAVGERGMIAMSDDEGRTWAQAQTVPTSATLNDVSFVDAKTGWVAGHWGTILKTTDGGQKWVLSRSDTQVDQPLFSIRFTSSNDGFAAGLWSLMLKTNDAGKTWHPVTLPKPEGASRADRNLFEIFSSKDGTIFVTAERGLIYRSRDNGANWESIATGYSGSLWAGLALDNGVLLVGGLAGNIYRSTDHGSSWIRVESGTKSSITDLVQLTDGSVLGTALEGVTLVSRDNGLTFVKRQDSDRPAYSAAVSTKDGKPLVFGAHGFQLLK